MLNACTGSRSIVMQSDDLRLDNASLVAHFRPGLDRQAVAGFIERFRGSQWGVSHSSACYPIEDFPQNSSPCAKSKDALFLAVFRPDAEPRVRERFRAWLESSGFFASIDCPACPSPSPSP